MKDFISSFLDYLFVWFEMPTKEESLKYYSKVFTDFQKDPKSTEKIEEFRRKYSKLTEVDLLKTFTI